MLNWFKKDRYTIIKFEDTYMLYDRYLDKEYDRYDNESIANFHCHQLNTYKEVK